MMPAARHLLWQTEKSERLRVLWAEGHSTAEIGRCMGVSKNAVVGKAHRLELPSRPSPIKGERAALRREDALVRRMLPARGAFANAGRLAELRRLRRKNLLASEIADAMGLATDVVRMALSRLAADCGDAAVIKARGREKARAASAGGGAKAAATRRRVTAEAAGRGQVFLRSALPSGVQFGGGGGLQGVITDAQRAALRRAVLAWQSDQQAATEAGLPLAEAKRVIALHRSAWLAETRRRGAQPKPDARAPLPPRTHERRCIGCREWGACPIGSLRCCACVAAEAASHAS